MRRIRASGAPNGTSCSPSASCGVLAPSPRTKRPDDSEASVAAAMAMVAALRFHTPMIPVPSADPRGLHGRLGQQHRRVVGPRLRQVEAVEAGAVGRRRQLGDDLAAVLERHERRRRSPDGSWRAYSTRPCAAPRPVLRSVRMRIRGRAPALRGPCSSPPPRSRVTPRSSWPRRPHPGLRDRPPVRRRHRPPGSGAGQRVALVQPHHAAGAAGGRHQAGPVSALAGRAGRRHRCRARPTPRWCAR